MRVAVIAVMVVVSFTMGFSQNRVAAGTMQAEISNELIVSTFDEADFAEVAPGVVYVVSPTGFKIPGGPSSPEGFEMVQPATWTIDGQGLSKVAVTFLLTDRLINESGGLIQVDYGIQSAGWNTTDDINESISLFDPRAGTVVNLDPDGHAFVSLGAILSVAPSAPAGEYTGVVGLSASYTGF